MKKVLFVCSDLTLGGVQKSLITLLNEWNGNGAEVWLMTGDFKAPLVAELPDYVKIVPTPWQLKAFQFRRQNLLCGVRAMWKQPLLLLQYLAANFRVLLRFDHKDVAKKKFWKKHHAKFSFLQEQYGKFDLAINYIGALQMWSEFTLDCIGAPRNICWVHGDYRAFGIKCAEERETLNRFDRVVAVSENTKNSLLESIPELQEKTVVWHNLLNASKIRAAAELPVLTEESRFSIVSVARLSPAKGLDLAIPAIARLVREGHDLVWYIVGEGSERQTLTELISQEQMQDRIILLGQKENPYTYMKCADLFLQTSRNEGLPVAVQEAKCLGCPILSTEYPAAREMITDGKDGMLVPISTEGIYQGIQQLLEHPELREQYRKNLVDYEPDRSVLQHLDEWVKE